MTDAKNPEYWFIFQNDRLLLLPAADSHNLPDLRSLVELKQNFTRILPLGTIHNIDCFAAEIDATQTIPSHLTAIPLRKAFESLPPEWYTAAAKAYSVTNWDKTHQFCGRCGSKTVHKPATFERMCQACGLAQYPRISPSIIVLIKKGDQLLMARSPHFPPGAYGLVAGFVEAGESMEDAVHREVLEETNIKIKNLHYFGSQSWPFPDSLMIGFTADYDDGEIQIDNVEIEDAGWYRYDNLPGRPSSSISIAVKLIDHFIDEQKTLERK